MNRRVANQTCPALSQASLPSVDQPLVQAQVHPLLAVPVLHPVQQAMMQQRLNWGLVPLPHQMLANTQMSSLHPLLGRTVPINQAEAAPAVLNQTALLSTAGAADAEAQQQQTGDAVANGGAHGADLTEQEADGRSESAVEDEQEEQSDWKGLLWAALHAAAPPSSFACSGHLQAPWLCPDISVSGVGRLGLPLSKEQAAVLKAAAEKAPHGRGLDTVLDTAVRDAFQVGSLKGVS